MPKKYTDKDVLRMMLGSMPRARQNVVLRQGFPEEMPHATVACALAEKSIQPNQTIVPSATWLSGSYLEYCNMQAPSKAQHNQPMDLQQQYGRNMSRGFRVLCLGFLFFCFRF